MDLFNRQTIKELKEEKNQLIEEVEIFREKEKTWMSQNQKMSKGIGNLLNEENLNFLIEYIARNNTLKLVLAPTVKSTKELDNELDEMMAGLWYGVIVYDNEKTVMEIPTLIEGDACFVSEMASKRREKNRYLMNALAEYLRMGLIYEPSLENRLKLIEIKEDLGNARSLFH